MDLQMKHSWPLPLLIILLVSSSSSCIASLCRNSDRDALLSFKSYLSYDTNVLQTWKEDTDCCQWNGISCNGNGSVTELYLQDSGIGGTLSDWIGKLDQLTSLDLSNNTLSGTIPTSLGNLTQLQLLFLHKNNLSGNIPSELGNLRNVNYLWLQFNRLSGQIPAELGKLEKILELNLESNQLSSTIPTELGSLTSLYYLILSNNFLTGGIPESFRNLSRLSGLYISSNRLSGPIPEISSSWDTLDLSSNEFRGNIPAWILDDSREFTKVNLSHNYFSSGISIVPPCSYLDLHANRLEGLIHLNFTVDFSRNQAILYQMDFSENGFTEIQVDALEPPVDGDLFEHLEYFSVAGNKIRGSIPSFIGTRMKEFKTLDLSRNRFTGKIPSSFLNLTRLTSFNVSHNHLTGEIPQGGVINSFPASAFEDNGGLCGSPLPSCKT